jgi:Flp pilus assembly protein TadG
MKPRWQAFFPATGGGLAMTFALSLPVVFGALGLASDYAMMTKVRGDLQAAADAAAIAGAYEVPLAQNNAQQVVSAVKSFASYTLVKNSAATESDLAGRNLKVSAEVIDDFSAVKVDISEQWTPFFAHFIADNVTPVNVTATARFVGRNNICVLGLAPKGTAVDLNADARLTGNNCGVFSNSTGTNSLVAESGVKLRAAIVCSSGGLSVSGTALVDPLPITDCPPVEDPLLKRQPPDVGSCDHHGLVINGETRTLDPGVYCGGLVIDGKSNVTLNPGVYVMKDGGLRVMGNATLSGDGAGFYITGAAQGTLFGLNSHISLSAPTSGPLAGLLIFEDRNMATNLNHRITSDDARTLIGTIYLPKGALLVDAKNPVADKSAYTAIVARIIKLNAGPNLVLNSNYEATDVPVPAGITGSSQVILSN